jgi:hypothetical protein
MTPLANFVAALHLSFTLALLLILIFKLVSDYRTDALRDRLFAVREKLFDYAAGGNVGFDDPAYAKLRMLLNGLIRFAHRLTFSRLTMSCVYMVWRNQPCEKNVLAEWHEALAALPEGTRNELNSIHNGAMVLVVRHLVTGSPILLCMLTCFAIWYLLNGFTKRSLEAFANHLPGLEALEAQTIRADADERQQHEEMLLAR